MLFISISFVAGVILLQSSPVLPDLGKLIALVFPFVLLLGGASKTVFLQQPWIKRILLCLLVMVLGLIWGGWRAELRLQSHLPDEMAGKDLVLTGVVEGLPQPTNHGVKFNFRPTWPSTVEASKLPSRVTLNWYGDRRETLGLSSPDTPMPRLRPGDVLALTVRLKPVHGNINPYGFDYEAWLLSQDVRATGYVRSGEVQASEAISLADQRERLRFQMRERMQLTLPDNRYPYSGVIIALAMGDQKAIPQGQWRVFNRTGISHLVSISGLHVTMVAGLFAGALGFLWRRIPRLALAWPTQAIVLWLGALGALGYALLAGFAVPAQRTAYMLLAVALAGNMRRHWPASMVLAFALLVVTVLDPWCVLAPGFWLSFLAAAALLWVSASEYGRVSGWRNQLKNWGKLQWTATLASLPVLLLIFQQFSLVSPIANALAIPVVSFLVTPLALLGAAFSGGPFLGWAHEIFALLMQAIAALAEWPLWFAAAPPVWVVVIGMIGVGLCLLPAGVRLRIAGGGLILPALFWQPSPLPLAFARITVLDVGQGLASVVQTREHTLIYDPGPMYGVDSDAGQRVMLPWLQAMGIQRVDRLIVTHPDSDHAGGLASVVFGLPVDEVMLSGEVSRLPGLVSQLSECEAGKRWIWDEVSFEILYPDAATLAPTEGKKIKSNHLSCVLKVSVGSQGMLLTSDIEAKDERKLLQQSPADLKAAVMMVPHHGSKTSSTSPFIEAVGAKDVVIPVGYMNRFGHPKSDVLARYQAAGATIWRTDRDGAVIVDLSRDGAKIKGWRKSQPRYWYAANE